MTAGTHVLGEEHGWSGEGAMRDGGISRETSEGCQRRRHEQGPETSGLPAQRHQQNPDVNSRNLKT